MLSEGRGGPNYSEDSQFGKTGCIDQMGISRKEMESYRDFNRTKTRLKLRVKVVLTYYPLQLAKPYSSKKKSDRLCGKYPHLPTSYPDLKLHWPKEGTNRYMKRYTAILLKLWTKI